MCEWRALKREPALFDLTEHPMSIRDAFLALTKMIINPIFVQ
jgi:hypothetical protein